MCHIELVSNLILVYYRIQTGTSLIAYGQAYRQPAGSAGFKSVKPGYPGLEAAKPRFTGLQNRPSQHPVSFR